MTQIGLQSIGIEIMKTLFLVFFLTLCTTSCLDFKAANEAERVRCSGDSSWCPDGWEIDLNMTKYTCYSDVCVCRLECKKSETSK